VAELASKAGLDHGRIGAALRATLPEFGSLLSVIFFAECFISGTRQRSSLPSATQKTIVKRKHSANKLFAEYCIFDTRERVSLPSVTNTTLGKELFVEWFFSNTR
jgi:hypothetical protein